MLSIARFTKYLNTSGGLHPLCHSTFDFEMLDISIQHRGDEKLFENRDYRQGLSLINRHNWLTPVAAEIAYAECAEELLGISVSERAKALRELTLRLQIANGRLLHVIGVLQYLELTFSELLLIREKISGVLEKTTGVRMHSSQVRIGGVADDLVENQILLETLDSIELPLLDFSMLDSVGLLTADDKKIWAITGIPSETNSASDRMLFEVEKINAAIKKAKNILLALDTASGPVNIQLPKVVRVPVGNSYKKAESATGRVGVWLHSDGEKSPLRVGLRAPSAKNLQGVMAMRNKVNPEDFVAQLLTIPMCPGEVAR